MKGSIEDVLPKRNGDLLGSSSGYTRDMLPVLIAVAGLVLILVFWAAFIRKRRRARSYSYHKGAAEPRHKRRRRSHRRNPTLAETGGLPPARDDQHSHA